MKFIYAARQHTDLTEGRGPVVPVAFFSHRMDALHANRELEGVMGSKNDCEIVEWILYDSLEEYKKHTGQAEKEKALAKLTPRERKILGL